MGLARRSLPKVTTPMLATLIDAPFDSDEWLFELKWDGFRALASIDPRGTVTLTSRNGLDMLGRFPALADMGKDVTDVPILLDGEIVSIDPSGRSSFQRLQNYMRHAENDAGASIVFVAFDVLYARGEDLRQKPLEERKAILASIVKKGARRVLYSSHVIGRGKDLFAAASAKDLEGIIGKRRASPYLEKRTRDWVKIKAQKMQECVIGGYTDPQGARTGFGSLHVGLYDSSGRLNYAGNVGTGFSRDVASDLLDKMKPLATAKCPFAQRPQKHVRDSHWIAPELVAQVRFSEWTDDGRMRHPAFLGLRPDKNPRECVREVEEPRPSPKVSAESRGSLLSTDGRGKSRRATKTAPRGVKTAEPGKSRRATKKAARSGARRSAR
jgi:bifunctional non-homologous end joining protein LigD